LDNFKDIYCLGLRIKNFTSLKEISIGYSMVLQIIMYYVGYKEIIKNTTFKNSTQSTY